MTIPKLVTTFAVVLASTCFAQRFDMTKIAPATLYTSERGYGYEAASDKPPYFFSVRVPEEGNYRVTVKFGHPKLATTTTVKAELRRLMLEKVETAPGKYVTRTFVVNVRRPQIAGGGDEVRLKQREKESEAWAWDDKLTLEFTNAKPGVTAIEIERARVPTLYIAGDSTSTDQPVEPYNSWGQMLTRFFKPTVAVANHGESGESLRGFVGEQRLAKLMTVMKPGDWLFIQMGHNDQKERGEGIGAFTSYKADLKKFIAAARERGTTPVLVTSMHRISWGPDGTIANSLGDYPEAARQTAKEENVALIDLHAMSKTLYEAIGQANLPKAFADNDKTHHNNYGSYQLAKCIVEGIRTAKLPLEKHLTDEARRFDPSRPDPVESFVIPAEPRGALVKPYGN